MSNRCLRSLALSVSSLLWLSIGTGAMAIPVSSVLDVHYDGSNVSTILGNVTSWNNQGLLGTAADATPSTVNSPTLITAAPAFNGQNVIDINPFTTGTTLIGGVHTSLRTPTFTSPMAQANHVFLVLNADVNTAGSGAIVFDGVVGTERHFFQITTAGGGHIFAGTSHFGGAGLTAGTPRIFSLVYNGASSQVDVNALPFFTPGNIGTQPLGQLDLGSAPSLGIFPTGQFDGQYAEVAVFNTNLNSAQQKIVENYLSAKFNVGGTPIGGNNTLGLTHDHYEGDLIAKGNYDFGVTGIGRVDASNEHLSDLDDGLSITASGGTLGDGEWLLGGHNGTANGIVIYESTDPTVIGTRWNRAYYLDKTGSLDATLGFDFEDSGIAVPANSNTFQLLYSPDNDFSNGWQVLDETTLISSGTVSFTVPNGLLLDGYYTLGVNVGFVPEPTSGLLLLGGLGMVVRRRRQLARK